MINPENCPHNIPPDEYKDGAKECPLCGTELGIGGLMLKHLGIEVNVEAAK